jgi:hypothetical protein
MKRMTRNNTFADFRVFRVFRGQPHLASRPLRATMAALFPAMAYINENYNKLKAGYLFPEIARRVKASPRQHRGREAPDPLRHRRCDRGAA